MHDAIRCTPVWTTDCIVGPIYKVLLYSVKKEQIGRRIQALQNCLPSACMFNRCNSNLRWAPELATATEAESFESTRMRLLNRYSPWSRRMDMHRHIVLVAYSDCNDTITTES